MSSINPSQHLCHQKQDNHSKLVAIGYQRALCRQRGLSLIGLIVGIALAAAFLLLISQMYANSVKSERFQEARSALQDQGRFLLSDIRRIVSVAGLDITDADVALLGSDGLQIQTTTSTVNDRITVAYRRSGGCRGSLATSTTTQMNNTEIFLNGTNLQCRDNIGAATGTGNAVTLANNIWGMRVLYGVDVDDDGFPDRYVQDIDIGGANVNSIRSIRIGVLVSSGDYLVSNDDIQTNLTYSLLGQDVVIPNQNDNNRRLFSTYETTIYLRNLSNAVLRFKN